MHIESIKLKNFKAFQNVTLTNIPPFCVFIGENGTGKTTLFNVFRFLKNCLTNNVRQAVLGFGGFNNLISRGHEHETVLIEIKFKTLINGSFRTITYHLEIGQRDKQIIVEREILKYRRYAQRGNPFEFLNFSNGAGYALKKEEDFSIPDEQLEREEQSLDAPDILAIKGLGQFERFKAANAFRKLIENWHVSDFHIDAGKTPADITGDDEHLSENGENLARVARNYAENHSAVFLDIKHKMSLRIPGVNTVNADITDDGRLVLKFGDKTFKSPFISRYVSDGTIKMFAYLILLNDPNPHPILCVEEPENQLHPALLSELQEEFSSYAKKKNGGQVFVSTHSPDFLNAVDIHSVFWLEKVNGYTTVHRAKDNPLIVNLIKEGEKMGRLWMQGYLKSSAPQ